MKTMTYEVFASFCPETRRVDFIHVTCGDYQCDIRPSYYDETNKLHVNAFIVATEVLSDTDDVIEPAFMEKWPRDYRFPIGDSHAINIS